MNRRAAISTENSALPRHEMVADCPKATHRAFNYSTIVRLALFLILLLVISAFVRSNIGTLSVVEGPSMWPTFKPDDIVQARTLYLEPERGTVVIIATDPHERVIKRVIGLPGESVTLYRGFVYINHQRLLEPYLPDHTYTFKCNQRDEQAITWHLGDQQYFVMGDNRLESFDSRNFGPVERHQINRIVNLPANEAKPKFGDVKLSDSGQPIKVAPHDPELHHPRSNLGNANPRP